MHGLVEAQEMDSEFLDICSGHFSAFSELQVINNQLCSLTHGNPKCNPIRNRDLLIYIIGANDIFNKNEAGHFF